MIYLTLDNDGFIIGISQGDVVPEGAIIIDSKPELKRGKLYKYLDNEIVEYGDDLTYLSMSTKLSKIKEVESIIVTTSSGKAFNGDETSQDRMTRAITVSQVTGKTETEWKLADNSIKVITFSELSEALNLASEAMSKIWLKD